MTYQVKVKSKVPKAHPKRNRVWRYKRTSMRKVTNKGQENKSCIFLARQALEKTTSGLVVGNQSFASTMTQVPKVHDPKCKVDYKISIEAYKNCRATYSNAYIIAINKKKKIFID